MAASPVFRRPAEPAHSMYGYPLASEAIMAVTALLFAFNIFAAVGFLVIGVTANAVLRARYIHGMDLAMVWWSGIWTGFLKKSCRPYWRGERGGRLYFG